MKLQLNSEFVSTEDESIISNLLRKGWIAVDLTRPDEPEFDRNLQKLLYNSEANSYSIINLSDEELSEIKSANNRLLVNESISNGFLIQPENFVLGLGDNDRSSFSQMLALVKEALDLGLITNDTPQIISDKDGQKHEISTIRFRQIMVAYGMYYKSLWDSL